MVKFHSYIASMLLEILFKENTYAGLKIFIWTYSSCGVSGLNCSLTLTLVSPLNECVKGDKTPQKTCLL